MTTDALRQAIHRKQLPATKVDGRLRIAAADLADYQRNRNGKT